MPPRFALQCLNTIGPKYELRPRTKTEERPEGLFVKSVEGSLLRVLRDQLGVLGLQGHEPADELVVFGVGNLGLVELVVPGVVVSDLVPKLFNQGVDIAVHTNDVTRQLP